MHHVQSIRRSLAFWLFFLGLLVRPAVAQPPEELLSTLSANDQAWVHHSCPKSLGPSLWSSCIRRQIGALVKEQPDLSTLKPDERAWVLRSCPASLGPHLTIACLHRETQVLARGIPRLAPLPLDKQHWISQACPQSLKPSLYKSCVERKITSLRQSPTMPQAPRLTSPTAPPGTTLRDPFVMPSPSLEASTPPVERHRRPRARAKAGDCERGHWIEFVSDDGEILKLEDGSVWRVDPGDTVDVSTWVPPVDVIVCDDTIINLDDNEKVGVTRLR